MLGWAGQVEGCGRAAVGQVQWGRFNPASRPCWFAPESHGLVHWELACGHA